MRLTHCVGCWCSDTRACIDETSHEPCHWLRVDRQSGTGVCSCCTDQLQAWDAGQWIWLVIWMNGPDFDVSALASKYPAGTPALGVV